MGSDNRGRNQAKQQADVSPRAQNPLLVHAVIAGLTPLIPLPFLDDWARNGIQTRSVLRISAAAERLVRLLDARQRLAALQRATV